MRVVLALVLVLSLLYQAAHAADFDHAGLARQTLERHLRPGYEQLLISAKKLESELETLCSVPPGSDLTPAKERMCFRPRTHQSEQLPGTIM